VIQRSKTFNNKRNKSVYDVAGAVSDQELEAVVKLATICFPDDPRKTIVGQAGDLRCGFAKSLSAGMENFASVVEFSLAGFQDDKILRQWIESPAVPIVHTLIDRPAGDAPMRA
jgi:hypothetical protein